MERLVDFFKPENYQISLDINKHKGEAKGEVIIAGEPTKSEEIKLHAKDLTIDRVRIDGEIVKFKHEGEILSFKKGKPSILFTTLS